MTIKEYIFIFDDDIFKIYAHNPKEAEGTFVNMCNQYAETDNEDWISHWSKLAGRVRDGNYQGIQNDDFIGVRRVL